ncbi:hypothetical protein QAD02_023598 [Eretmocerus hayati]|uniref:Uncharacterized protein n=1 Tax=Eretmocerus hayati TaxID=131215 RepID=A0ACC2PW22_9HYME|nr:hypothetical protein QAD02_023598 [Eretmocerus hayati]
MSREKPQMLFDSESIQSWYATNTKYALKAGRTDTLTNSPEACIKRDALDRFFFGCLWLTNRRSNRRTNEMVEIPELLQEPSMYMHAYNKVTKGWEHKPGREDIVDNIIKISIGRRMRRMHFVTCPGRRLPMGSLHLVR